MQAAAHGADEEHRRAAWARYYAQQQQQQQQALQQQQGQTAMAPHAQNYPAYGQQYPAYGQQPVSYGYGAGYQQAVDPNQHAEHQRKWAEYYERQRQWQEYYARQDAEKKRAEAEAAQQASVRGSPRRHEQAAVRGSPTRHETEGDGQERGGKQSVGWPPALKKYVERALAGVDKPAERERAEAVLQARIEDAIKKNAVLSTDWDNEPLPPRDDGPRRSSPKRPFAGPKSVSPKRQERYAAHNGQEAGQASWLAHGQAGWGKKTEPAWAAVATGKRGIAGTGATARGKKKFKVQQAQLASTFVGEAGSNERRAQRAQRFAAEEAAGKLKAASDAPFDPYAAAKQEYRVKQALHEAADMGVELDLSQFTVKGTSQKLEKKFLRLTGVPHPSTVRPQPVLEKALAMVEERWARSKHNKAAAGQGPKEGSDESVSYLWVCEQLKSVRQDLTVQHIKNAFTARAYEVHARIALREEDLKEFNQCLTQVQELYKQGDFGETASRHEFAAYNVHYLLYTHLKYGLPATELATLLRTMDPATLGSREVQHALRVRSALLQGSHTNFFRLRACAPALCGHLMDFVVGFVRHHFLRAACSAYRPSLPLAELRRQLRLEGAEHDAAWRDLVLDNPGAVLSDDKQRLDTKASVATWAGAYEWPVLDGDAVMHA